MITVKISAGILSGSENQSVLSLEYEKMTLNQLIEKLEIDRFQVGAILVNHKPAKPNEVFENQAVIHFLPVLSGG